MKAILVFAISAFLVAGCGIEDNPMPMSLNNIEKLATELKKITANIDPVPGHSKRFMVLGAYKEAVEDGVGYSFDKTIRQCIVVGAGQTNPIMLHAMVIVLDEPKKALESKFISDRTYDLVMMGKKSPIIQDGQEQILKYVMKCEDRNGGSCDNGGLMQILEEENVLPPNLMRSNSGLDEEPRRLARIDIWADSQYGDIISLGIDGLLVKPDNSEFSSNGLFSGFRSPGKFKVNKEKLILAKKYMAMKNEELQSYK